ncbi:hypothetical protein MN116_008269 [Schistosoma mekongi]|uniref:Fork-head domain-containing protein n=1 Tax=Schistosoma mekongi TaxID=38744 RepID=A0AAE2D1W6_SCHME|nr:hypothetical protein MN116_008269 [Schistosoma mekongi]
MMFEYTSDYLAEKLRENWLLRCHTNELTQWNKQEQDDDSLTNLNWLQTLNIHEFTCTGQPFSPPSTPPLHQFASTNDNQFVSTSTLTTKNLSSQKLHTIHSSNVSLNSYKHNNYSLFTSLRHRNENTTYPIVNNTKHLTYYTTDNDNHNSISSSSSVGNISKQYKELPLRCLNNTINFYPNYHSIHHQHTPVYTTINTTMSNNNNYQSMLDSIYVNNNDPYLVDDKLYTNTTYDLSNCNANSINGIMVNSNGNNYSLQNAGNPLKLGHYSLLPYVQKLLQNNIHQSLDMNLGINSITTDVMDHNSSHHLHHHHHHQQQQHRHHPHGNNVNSVNHNILDDCMSNIQNDHYVIPNSKVFLKYDTLTFHEKDTYQHNEQCKPMLNAHTLIYMAMNELKKNKVTFHDICEWIIEHFAFYRNKKDNFLWQDIIRQNLTFSRCFQRVPRRKQEPDGNSDLWRINPELQNQLLNNRISSRFSLIWQNQISPKLPDLIEFIEQYSSTSSSELNTYQRDNTNDHNVIDDDEKKDYKINNNTTFTHLHDHSDYLDQYQHHHHHHRQLLHNSTTNTLKRRYTDSSDNLTDYIKSHTIFNNDMTCQSNSSSSPALSDFYTSPPPELLSESTSDLTSSLLLDNEYNFNTSLNSIGLNENTIYKVTNNISNHVLRNTFLNQSMNSSSPPKLIEHEQYCDDLHGLFNEQKNHSMVNDQYLFYAPIDIDSTTTSTITATTATTTTVTNNSNNNNSSSSNGNNNNNRCIVEELSKASGLNEIPPLDDFDNDELVDPLDLTMNSVNSRLSNDWWSNNNNHNNTSNCLSESMTNFINCTLNELTSTEEEDNDEKDESKGVEKHCEDDVCSADGTCCNVFNKNCKSMLNNEQNNIKQSNDDDECINTMSSSLRKDEFSLSYNITTFSSTLVPTIVSESSIISSLTTTSLLIPTTRCNMINNEINDSMSLSEDYSFFNKLQMTIIKHQQNKSLISEDDTDVDDSVDVNQSLQSPLQNQQWIDHKVNLDDLDSILGLSYHLN